MDIHHLLFLQISWFSGKWACLKGNYYWRYIHFSLNHGALSETNSKSSKNGPLRTKREGSVNRLPTIHFQGGAVSFFEG